MDVSWEDAGVGTAFESSARHRLIIGVEETLSATWWPLTCQIQNCGAPRESSSLFLLWAKMLEVMLDMVNCRCVNGQEVFTRFCCQVPYIRYIFDNYFLIKSVRVDCHSDSNIL